MKRPQGPIEIPPSVQNPQEGRSRSQKVTFQCGNQKKKKKQRKKRGEGSGGDDDMKQSERGEATRL